MRVALVHGGLYEGMTAERFWVAPGVADGLRVLGHQVSAPQRLPKPSSWNEEADRLASAIEPGGAVVAGSNGCVAALRLAIQYPTHVARLVLCWPPAAGVQQANSDLAKAWISRGLPAEYAAALLGGEAIRGCTDDELKVLRLPVAVIPSNPPNRQHPASTVASLRALIKGVVVGEGFTESPRLAFATQTDAFVAELDRLLRL